MTDSQTRVSTNPNIETMVQGLVIAGQSDKAIKNSLVAALNQSCGIDNLTQQIELAIIKIRGTQTTS